MYIADLHIHSKYSRATSKDCDAAHLAFWARRKGIQLIGTGDFTHPAWRAELHDVLEPAEEGLYTLRDGAGLPEDSKFGGEKPRFVLSGEISTIYKKDGRVRKVHHVILLPGLEDAERLAQKLEAIGNIHSDGRPILGLDSHDLLEITLEACPQAIYIPAHIWTPHFSLFGAFSGFDTIESCYGDLTKHIHALETGLSSDPPMNWRVSALDGLTLVSNSDAHSPAKLGREANLIDAELSYPALKRAIETGEGFGGTLEFFPEEGKYHLDGHRSCGICLTPAETERLGGKCPVCGRKITIGVENRVEQLADRAEGFQPVSRKPFESLVPLTEVIAASTGVSASGKKAAEGYGRMLHALGSEFYILRQAPLDEIERSAGACVAEGIRRLRKGEVERSPGFDGEYGNIFLLAPEEMESLNGQASLFGTPEKRAVRKPAPKAAKAKKPAAQTEEAAQKPLALNAEQLLVVTARERAAAVIAGPGTGKTKTLTERIAYLIEQCGVKPSQITAVTFTNQAAGDMRQRLEARLGRKRAVRGMTIGTFHAVCMQLLGDVTLLDGAEALSLAGEVIRECGLKIAPRAFLQALSKGKNGLECDVEESAREAYQTKQNAMGVLDFDDLLLRALAEKDAKSICFTHLLVDEFQDINGLQYQLVKKWSAGAQSLFVIGDPDQSIYGFRGADAGCFARLKEETPGLREFRLTENYRSTPQILSASLAVMAGDGAGERPMHANCAEGTPVRLLEAKDDFSEAVFIAREISRMVGGTDMLDARADEGRTLRSFSDIAVLCRTHHQMERIESCLRHDSIPCVIVGREEFLEDAQVRGLLGFFRFLLDARDIPSLRVCLRELLVCPADLAEKAEQLCLGAEGDTRTIHAALHAELGAYPQLALFFHALEEYAPLVEKERPRALLERWQEGNLESAALERLLRMSVFHDSMGGFLQTLMLGAEGDLRRASSIASSFAWGKTYASGAVRLMTLHGAKGLEFPAVFLAGVKKGSIPLESSRHPVNVDEERRLLFVGMTRAREELIVMTSRQEPSAFLRELPVGMVDCGEVTAFRRELEMQQLRLF